MSTRAKGFFEVADELVTWAERFLPGGARTTALIGLGVVLSRTWGAIMDDLWLFLGGVATGSVLLLIGLAKASRWVRARGEQQEQRAFEEGLTGLVEGFEALFALLQEENVEPDKVRWSRIHYQIWCAGHDLEKAGVRGYPDADNPDFIRWESYLGSLVYLIRKGEYERIQELHEIMPPPQPPEPPQP